MSKSILVIDTPESCAECPLIKHQIDCIPEDYCIKGNRELINPDEKPGWCPLKEIPQKLAEENRWFSKDYAVGYNACIDEILKKNCEN